MESASRTFGASRPSLRMPSGELPTVDRVMLSMEMQPALGSLSTNMDSRTASRLAIGSPIPWYTTPCTRPPRPPGPRRRRSCTSRGRGRGQALVSNNKTGLTGGNRKIVSTYEPKRMLTNSPA
eukprot:971719-Pyramimonas_sp.AAC.1